MPQRVSPSLIAWSGVLLALLAAHDLSHALDDGLKTSLGALALVALPQWVALAIVMAVIVRSDRARGAPAAMLLGLAVAVGFVFAHLLPFSPGSYWDLQPTLASWVLAWLPVGLGLMFAALAWAQWRPAGRSRGGVAAGTHPA